MQYANLHLHSTFSDAGFTPGQLVKIGKALGYGALALTDHETDGGCASFMRACERGTPVCQRRGVLWYLRQLDLPPDRFGL